jgi:hypothetical protein
LPDNAQLVYGGIFLMKSLLPVVLAAALSACVATTPRIESGRLVEVHRGKTTVDEVVKRFGTPSVVSRNPDGTQFATYVHADPDADPKAVVPLVVGVLRDSVTFHFDTKGLLTEVKTTSRTGAERSTAQAMASKAANPSATSTPTASSAPAADRAQPGKWSWKLPEWLPATPRENR